MQHRYIVGFIFLLTFGTSYAQVADLSKDEVLNAGLPVLEITTVDNKLPTCDTVSGKPYGINVNSIANATKVPGRLTISTKEGILYDSEDYDENAKTGMTFKIRGNTSGLSVKKPYKIKLQKKADLLGRKDKKYQNKDWVLIYDKNYLAKVGLKVNELMGLQWTPQYEYVNVMINGKYQGLYMLLESVKRDEDSRLNVSKDGYIFEYDMYWWKEDYYVQIPTYLPWKMYYTFKYPEAEDMTDAQKSYFTDMITTVENSIKDGTYPEYIDVNSFASWMLAHDILGSSDGSGSNIYMTKYDNTDNSKVMMANMWDFDSALQITEGWSAVHTMFYFKYLFDRSNPNNAFIRAYKNRWNEVSPTIFDALNAFLDEFLVSEEATALDTSADWDNQLWKWKEESQNRTVQQLVNIYKRNLGKKKTWLTGNVSSFPSGIAKGDANSDYAVNVEDVIEIANTIMGNRSGKFNDDAADMNNDKSINIKDIVKLVKEISSP